MPRFKALGLKADLWCRERIDTELSKAAHVRAHFFGGESRHFLSLLEAEARHVRSLESIHGGQLGSSAALKGRAKECASIEAFLKDATCPLLILRGLPGVGVTRLLREAGRMEARTRNDRTVLWANTSTLVDHSGWFVHHNTERSTLLVVDDLREATLLPRLKEQVLQGTGWPPSWKVILGLKEDATEALRWIEEHRQALTIQEIRLPALEPSAAVELALEWMEADNEPTGNPRGHRQAAQSVVSAAGGMPAFIALGVRRWQAVGLTDALPDGASAALLRRHIEALSSPIGNHASPVVRDVLCWIALMEGIRRSDDALTRLALWVSEGRPERPLSVREAATILDHLEARGALNGPDRWNQLRLRSSWVERQVLLDWAVSMDGSTGSHALMERLERLLARIQSQTEVRARDRLELEALARLENTALPNITHYALRARIWQEMHPLQSSLESSGRSAQLLDVLHAVARHQPVQTVEWIRNHLQALKREPVDELAPARITAFVGPLKAAAKGADCQYCRRAIVAALHAIALLHHQHEQAKSSPAAALPSDSSWASDYRKAPLSVRALIDIAHGQEGVPPFHDAFLWHADRVLDDVAKGAMEGHQVDLAVLMVECAVKRHRDVHFSGAREGRNIRTTPLLDAPVFKSSRHVRRRVLELLGKAEGRAELRIGLWRMLKGVHHQLAGQLHPLGKDYGLGLQALRSEDFIQVLGILRSRDVCQHEMEAARGCWKPYMYGGIDPEGPDVVAALQLEDHYLSGVTHPLVRRLFATRKSEVDAVAADCANELAAATPTPESLLAVLYSALEQALNPQHSTCVYWLALQLGKHEAGESWAEPMTRALLDTPMGSPERIVGINFALGRLRRLREHAPNEVIPWLERRVSSCHTLAARVDLITRLLEGPWPARLPHQLTEDEFAWLSHQSADFLATKRSPCFITLSAQFLPLGWDRVRALWDVHLQDAQQVDSSHFANAQCAGVLGVHAALRKMTQEQREALPKAEILKWLTAQRVLLTNKELSEHTHDVESTFEWLGFLELRALAAILEDPRASDYALLPLSDYRDANDDLLVPWNWVKPIDAQSPPSESDQEALHTIVRICIKRPALLHSLPAILHRLDPGGHTILNAVRTLDSRYDESLLIGAKIGALYFGQPVWRDVALHVLRNAASTYLFLAASKSLGLPLLRPQHCEPVLTSDRTWLEANMAAAERELEREDDEDMKSFWRHIREVLQARPW